MDHIINNLYIGDYLDSRNLLDLKKNQIKYIVNCAGELGNSFQGIFWYLNIPIKDPDLEILKYTNMIKSQLNGAFGQPILIHCHQGISRSVTVATIFLSWKLQKSWQEVIGFIKTCRPKADPNSFFKTCLNNLQNERKI